MKFSTALHEVHSEQGKKAIARNSLFGAIGALRSAVSRAEGMAKSVTVLREKKYEHRANAIMHSKVFLDTQAKMEDAAKRAQGIWCIASASFDIKPEFEPGVPKHMSQEQLAQIAEFSGMSVNKVIELRTNADNKRYASELEAMSMTEAMFWSAEPDEDPEVKADSVLRALHQTMQFIMTWSNPDFAELGILKYDIERMETIAQHEKDRSEVEGPLGMKINSEDFGKRTNESHGGIVEATEYEFEGEEA
jgi:hypothetical protein